MEQSTGLDGQGRWWALGTGADIDEAWDQAKDAALAAWGSSFSGSGLDAADFEAGPEAIVELAAKGQVAGHEGFFAQAVANPRDWSLRKARVAVTDPSLVFGAVGELAQLGEKLRSNIDAALAEAGKLRDESEEMVSATLTALRRRAKVVATRHSSPSAKRFVVLVGDSVEAVESSLADAKKKAKELAAKGKAEIYSLGGRAGDLPLVEMAEQVLAQKATVAVVLAKLKKLEQNRTAAWLFSGPLEAPATEGNAAESHEDAEHEDGAAAADAE